MLLVITTSKLVMQEEAGGFIESKPHLPSRKETVCVRVYEKDPTVQAYYLQMWGQVTQESNTEAIAVSMAFPDASVVKNPPTNAGFNPWSGKIPHAVG